ncbi:TonB-dependent receptor [Phenylobacterium sp.]|uniref:TonB-dependent receptor n=1 Tax=Phenylobacterium sp. TaxID=1871053 RepID=UPI002BC5584B|nr:TonB-dependent receptor [Phenylobacterium sp.]HLZ74763.1 TonB-dependent receptor [Phenylobacterium sp.]
MTIHFRRGAWRHQILSSAMAVAAASVALPAAAAESADFHIAAQPVQSALKALSEQSGARLLYPFDEVAGLRSQAVSGRMSTRQALEKIIAGTPLKIAMIQDGLIALTGPAQSGGLIKTSAGAGAAPLSATAAATPAAATGDATGAASPKVSDVQELIVTGVRGAPRTVTDSPTPVDVISNTELEKTGRIGALQALSTLVPSFNLPARAGGGTATVIATGGLRGLNPDQTLVLVNGKRRHKTALINAVSSLYNGSVPADLDMIPTSAIGRIEVLRDGAAAQYGSDAIAGVINIILKDTEGGFVSASDGENFDRHDGRLIQVQGDYGVKFADDKGFVNLSIATKEQDLSNRAIPVDPSVQIYPKLVPSGLPDPRELTVNRLVTLNYGVLPQEGVNFGWNGHYDLSSGAEVYSFGTLGHRLTDLPFTFRSPNNVNTLPQIYPEGFRPDLVIRELDYEAAIGVRGDWNGWSWDLSTDFGSNHATENTSDTLNASLGPTSPTSFYVGALTSTEWDTSIDLTKAYKLANDGNLQVSLGAQYRRETYRVDAGDPNSYAAGLYVIPAGQPFAGQRPATEAQATPGFQPSDASSSSRGSYAAYGELDWTPSKRLDLGVAARYEDYDDGSGDTLVGKANGRFAFTDWLAIRGAVSTGFRAPGLAQEHYAASSSQFRLVNSVLDLLLIKTLPVSSPSAIALGAKPLQPETSTNYSLGLAFDPTSSLTVTLDAYRIDIDKRIAITSTLTGAAVSNILIAHGLSGDLSAQYYTNAIDTETNGVDLVATWRHDFGDWGALHASAGYNYNKTKITGIIPNPPALSALGPTFVLFDRASQSNLTTAFPKDKIALEVNWTLGNWSVNARDTRFGTYTILQDTPSQDRSFGAKWIADLEVAYKLPHDVTLAVGANNLFNVYPDANGIFNATTGSGQYPGTSPMGFTGGSYYGRIQWNF